MNLAESIRLSTSTHEKLLLSLDPTLMQGEDIRPACLFLEWIDQNRDGFYIRDLDHVIQVMDYLEDYVAADGEDAMTILEGFLELCAVPLMELKANERLSMQGSAKIKRFFSKLSGLWSVGNAHCKLRVGNCFRCIVRGGKDPAMLRSQQKDWVSDGFRQRVTDNRFLVKCLRGSRALETIVFEFSQITDILDYSLDQFISAGPTVGDTETPVQELEVTVTEEIPTLVSDHNDPEFYGVPRSFLHRNNVVEEVVPVEEVADPAVSFLDCRDHNEDSEGTADGSAAGGAEHSAENTGEGEDLSVSEYNNQSEVVDKGSEVCESAQNNLEIQPMQAETSDEISGAHQEDPVESAEKRINEVEWGEPLAGSQEVAVDENENVKELEGSHEPVESIAAELPQEEAVANEDLAVESVEECREDGEQLSPINSPAIPSLSTQTPELNPAILRELSQVLLSLCLDLSKDMACATVMCQQGLCDGAVMLIEKDFKLSHSDPRISTIIELLWNVLEPFLEQFKSSNRASPDEVRCQLSNYSDYVIDFGHAVEVFQSLIVCTMHEGFRQADKELRNEVLIILTMLAQFPCAVGHFLHSGLFHLLITYSCIEEAGAESWDGFCTHIGKDRNFATVSDIDLEFKKEIWFVLAELLRSNDPEALAIFSSSPLQATMLQYMEHDSLDSHIRRGEQQQTGAEGFNISVSMNASQDDTLLSRSIDGNSKNLKPLRLTAATVANAMATSSRRNTLKGKKPLISLLPLSKLREFQLLAVAFLLHNAPRVLQSFEAMAGPVRVISLVLHYCQSDVQDHKIFTFYCLILLQKCLDHSVCLRTFMETNNLIQTFLYVYHKCEKVETQAQCLRLIATLCCGDNRPMQFQFSQLGGISDMVGLLSNYVRNRPPLVGTRAGVKLSLKYSAELPDPLENPYGGEISILVIASLDCLMQAVVGNAVSESIFSDMEGMDVLLDLMETSPFILRLQVLRFLSNILSNRQLVMYVNAWRSPKTLRSAAQILCHCWQDEEARVFGEKRQSCIISDLSHPLNSKGSYQQPGQAHLEALFSSCAGVQANANQNRSDSTQSSQSSSSQGNYFQDVANATSNSITVTKLAAAILVGRNATQTNLPIDICNAALERDSRVLISSILDSLGVFDRYGIQQDHDLNELLFGAQGQLNDHCTFEDKLDQQASPVSHGDLNFKQVNFDHADRLHSISSSQILPTNTSHIESRTIEAAMATLQPVNNALGLTFTDQQVLSMAKLYSALREAEWWHAVQLSAGEIDIIPIEADIALAEKRLAHARLAAGSVQAEQIYLFSQDDRVKKDNEEIFVRQIIIKKNQQIKSEWLKKNGTKLVTRAPTKVNKRSTDRLVA